MWKPIDTAPRDGTWIMACAPNHVPAIVRWSEKWGTWTEFDDWDEDADRTGEKGWGLKYWQHYPEVPRV